MGPNAGLAVLAAEARREALPNIVRLLPAARDAGVRVVHCLVQRRPDGQGSNHNARLFAGGAKGVDITPGQRGSDTAARTRARSQPISCCPAGTASARWAAPTSTRSCATSA